MNRITLSFIVAVAFAVLGSMGLTAALQLPFATSLTKIGGPGTFPAIVLVLIIICSVILAVTELVKSSHVSRASESQQSGEVEKKDILRILLMIAVVVIYTLSLNTAGFMLSTSVLTMVLLWLFGYRNKFIAPVLAVGFPALSYFLFRTVLKISLP